MADIVQRLKDLWQRASMVQRFVLLGVVFGLVIGGVLATTWMARPRMVLLYSKLEPEDAAAVVEKLKDAGVKYELRSGGTTVYVEEEKKSEMRLTMAQAGLPTGGSGGYSILDSEPIGLSPERQRTNFYRAIEGELCKTIESIQGVGRARVHVVKPQTTLLRGPDAKASASVMVTMNSGQRLSAGQVATIIYLVSGAVEGLSQEHVVVADSQGNLKTGEARGELAAATDGLFDYKSRVEDRLTRKITDALTGVLGANRVRVNVSAEIETASTTTTTEKVDPDSRAPKREEEEIESSSSGGAAEGAEGETTEKSRMTVEYLTSTSKTVQTQGPGQTKSISIAAFVDLSGTRGDDGEPLTVAAVEEWIRSAAGAEKIAALKVIDHPFAGVAGPEMAPEPVGWASPSFLLELGRQMSLGMLALGAVAAILLFRRKKGGKSGRVDIEQAQAGQLPGGQGQGALSGGQNNLLPMDVESASPEMLRSGINQAVQQNPQEVRKMFMNWMQSEEGE